MKRVAYVLMVLNLLAWGGLVWVGVDGLQGVANQHVPGYPDSGQKLYYVGYPLAALAIALAPSVLLLRWDKDAFAVGLLVATLVGLPFYLFAYGGGV